MSNNLSCSHCGAPVVVPDILGDGDEYRCKECGGVNRCDYDEDGVDFAPCETEGCEACAREVITGSRWSSPEAESPACPTCGEPLRLVCAMCAARALDEAAKETRLLRWLMAEAVSDFHGKSCLFSAVFLSEAAKSITANATCAERALTSAVAEAEARGRDAGLAEAAAHCARVSELTGSMMVARIAAAIEALRRPSP